MFQSDRIVGPEIDPCIYGHLIHDKEEYTVEKSVFNKWCQEKRTVIHVEEWN